MFGRLLCSMARIYDLWDESLDQRSVRESVPYSGQEYYQLKYRNAP